MNGRTTWNFIATVIGNPESYNWKVQAAASTNCNVKVVLKDANGTMIGKDVRDKVFTIQP